MYDIQIRCTYYTILSWGQTQGDGIIVFFPVIGIHTALQYIQFLVLGASIKLIGYSVGEAAVNFGRHLIMK